MIFIKHSVCQLVKHADNLKTFAKPKTINKPKV